MAEETRFTPGPWGVTEDGEIIAAGGIDIPDTDDDVALIAAAPDLYEALRELVRVCEHAPTGRAPNLSMQGGAERSAMAGARAALSKASPPPNKTEG